VTEQRPLRLFVAVGVPEHLLESLSGATEEFRRGLPPGRWAPPENQHVTLKFLGSSPAGSLAEIGARVGVVSSAHRAAELRLGRLGTWPSRRRARVLWAGLADEAGLLHSLAAGLDEALGPLGFEPEKREFTPHLTLARWRVPIPLDSPLPELPDEARAPFTVGAVELFRSHLSPKGARYEVLRSFSLTSTAQ